MVDLIHTPPADTRASSTWRPLVVTAHMAEPVVTTDAVIHLDGVLAWGAFRAYERRRDRPPLPPMTSAACVDFTIPLATWRFGDVWGWCASAAQWPVQTIRSTEYVRRKPPEHEYKQYTSAGRYDIALGPAKAHNKPITTSFCRTLTWYALGDRDAVAALLRDVTAIGKLVGHGHGVVMRWEVDETGHEIGRAHV